MNIQKRLEYLTKEEVKGSISNKVRGIAAFWKEKENTACLSFYFDGEISNNDKEEASDICTYIIAHFPDGLLEENYIRWDYPKPLPNKFLVYKRLEV